MFDTLTVPTLGLCPEVAVPSDHPIPVERMFVQLDVRPYVHTFSTVRMYVNTARSRHVRALAGGAVGTYCLLYGVRCTVSESQLLGRSNASHRIIASHRITSLLRALQSFRRIRIRT